MTSLRSALAVSLASLALSRSACPAPSAANDRHAAKETVNSTAGKKNRTGFNMEDAFRIGFTDQLAVNK